MSSAIAPLKFQYFVRPPERVYREWDGKYLGSHPTYTSYNYLGRGPVARIKALHFETALRLTRADFGRARVIDFGCADGVFLPSLARRFPRVCAVDTDPRFLAVAQRVVDELHLDRVELVCNRDTTMEELGERLRPESFQILFLLETLEHVGEPGRLYESKMDFLEQLFGLLAPGGRIVISVPTMVGMPFAVQRAVLAGCRLYREPIARGDFLRAVFKRDATPLEPNWTPTSHLGFNHLKLERYMRERFRITTKKSLFLGLGQIYVLDEAISQ